MQASFQPITFIDFKEINAMENIAHGMCLISAFFQGLSGNDRMAETIQRKKISNAITSIVNKIDAYEDKRVSIVIFNFHSDISNLSSAGDWIEF